MKKVKLEITAEAQGNDGLREMSLQEKTLMRRVLGDQPELPYPLHDLHERKEFKVRDLRIIRWNDANLLVSPDYPKSGGTLLDWVGTEAGAMQIVASLVSPEYKVK